MSNTTKTGEFLTHKNDNTQRENKNTGLFNSISTAFNNSSGLKNLLKNSVICLLLAVGLIGLKLVTTEPLSKSELIEDKNIGRLQYVSSNADISIPIDGEIIETFASNGEYSKIRALSSKPVFSLFSGTVIKTAEDYVVINNDNGTQTTYTGVIPSVNAGAVLLSNEAIGQLSGDTLTLSTVGGIGFMDSLALPDEFGDAMNNTNE